MSLLHRIASSSWMRPLVFMQRDRSSGKGPQGLLPAFDNGFELRHQMFEPLLGLGHRADIGGLLIGQVVDRFAKLPRLNPRFFQELFLNRHRAVMTLGHFEVLLLYFLLLTTTKF